MAEAQPSALRIERRRNGATPPAPASRSGGRPLPRRFEHAREPAPPRALRDGGGEAGTEGAMMLRYDWPGPTPMLGTAGGEAERRARAAVRMDRAHGRWS